MIAVGWFVGETGMAAVSNASMLSFIMNSICIGLTAGGTVLTAQYKGAGDRGGQCRTAATVLYASLAASAAVCALGMAAYRPIFRIMDVPPEAMDDACGYMGIVCLGTVFVFGYNAVCSVMKGMGDSRCPLLCVAAAAVVNIALDIILVGPLRMGTTGAAYATVFSQGVSFFAAVTGFIWKFRNSGFDKNDFVFQKNAFSAVLRVGLPSAIQMAAVNVSYLMVAAMLNHFGTDVAAAAGAGLKVNTFAGMPCWAVGQAVTAMAGQNIGAGNIAGAEKTVMTGLKMNIAVTSVSVLFIQAFAEPIVMIFGITGAAADAAVSYLRICCGANGLAYAAMYTFDSFAVGAGAAHIAMLNAFLDAALIRLPLCWTLAFSLDLGFRGVYIGQALSPALPALVGLLYFKSGLWSKKRLA